MPEGGGDSPIDEVQNDVIVAMANELGELRREVEQHRDDVDQVRAALASIAGLEGLGAGVAQIVELLAPLRQLVPAAVSGDLTPGVNASIDSICEVLGLVVRDGAGTLRLIATGAAHPVTVIGQAPPNE